MALKELVVKISADISDFEKKASVTEAAIRNIGQRSAAVGRALTVGVTAPLVAFAAISVKAAADMDKLRRGMVAVTGSTGKAATQMARLKEVAKLPGLGFEDAVRGSINLQAAGFSAEMAERALRGFGNALATVGRGREELDGVIRALTQIAAKGKVSAEEINQLAERIPQIREVMRAAFGSANTEVLQAQGLEATEFIAGIITELEKLPKVSGGVQESFDNLGDSAKRASAAIGEELLPVLIPIVERLATMAQSIEEVDAGMVRWGVAIGATAAIVGPLALVIGGLTTAASVLAIALGTTLLPVVAVGAPLLLGLGALTAKFIKNKLDALDAAAAVDEYRRSLENLEGFSLAEAIGKERELQAKLKLVESMKAQLDEIEQRGQRGTGVRGGVLNLTTVLSDEDRRAAERIREFLERNPGAEELKEDLEDVRDRIGDIRNEGPKAIADGITRPLTTAADEAERLARAIRDMPSAPAPSISVESSGIEAQLAANIARRERERQERIQRGEALGMILSPIEVPGGDVAPEGELRVATQAITDGVRGLVDLGDAAGALDNNTRRAVTGVTNLVSSLDNFLGAKGILGQVGAGFGVAGAAAGILSGVVGALFNNEAERERNKLLASNNEELRDLRMSLSGFRATFDVQSAALSAIDTALAELFPGKIGRILATDDLEAGLRAAGLSLDEFAALAERFNLEVFDSAGLVVPDALEQLAEAIRETRLSVTRFGETLDGQRALSDARLEIFDLTSPIDQLRAQFELFESAAPDLLRQFGLSNLNLESETGRSVLEGGLREIFEQFAAGDLSAEDLGAFTSVQEFIDSLVSVDGALDGFGDTVRETAAAFSNVPQALNLAVLRFNASAIGGGGATGGSRAGSGATSPGRDTPGGDVTRPGSRPPISVTVNVDRRGMVETFVEEGGREVVRRRSRAGTSRLEPAV